MKSSRPFVMVLAALAAAAAIHALAEEQGAPPPQSGKSEQPKQANQTIEAVEKLAQRSDLIVLGDVTAVHDGTARDAGMSYDVRVDEVIKGEYAKGTLHFRSAGWVGYARYSKGEKVLLFLYYWAGSKPPELLQLQPITYVAEKEQPERGLWIWPLEPLLLDASVGRLVWYHRGSRAIHLLKHSADDGWVYAPPIPYEPTKDRPIILKKGELIFGGKDGSREDTIEWKVPVISKAVNPSGQRAAVVTASQGNPTILRVYDPDRTLLSETKLTEEPYFARVWIADDGFAVVGLGQRLEDMQRNAMTLRRRGEKASRMLFPPPPFEVFVVLPTGEPQGLQLQHGDLVDVRMLGQQMWVALVYSEDTQRHTLALYKHNEAQWTNPLPVVEEGVRGYSILSARDTIGVLGPNFSSLVFGLDGTLLRKTHPHKKEMEPYEPTKDQPIILKNRRLLFGGQAGNEQHEMTWSSPPIFQTVAPGGKLAAAVLIKNGTTIAQIVNPQREVTKTNELASEERTARLWLGDDGQMLAGVGPTIAEMESLVQRSMYSKTPVIVNYEWAYYAPDGARVPVALEPQVVEVAMFDDARWGVFCFDAGSDSFRLSMWREGERLWSKVIRKSRKEDVGFSMSVARGKTPRIMIYTPGGALEYDLEGREITTEQHQKGDEQ